MQAVAARLVLSTLSCTNSMHKLISAVTLALIFVVAPVCAQDKTEEPAKAEAKSAEVKKTDVKKEDKKKEEGKKKVKKGGC